MGDIEDMGDGSLAVICPWHSYDFNLKDGSSSTGLKVNKIMFYMIIFKKFVKKSSELNYAW